MLLSNCEDPHPRNLRTKITICLGGERVDCSLHELCSYCRNSPGHLLKGSHVNLHADFSSPTICLGKLLLVIISHWPAIASLFSSPSPLDRWWYCHSETPLLFPWVFIAVLVVRYGGIRQRFQFNKYMVLSTAGLASNVIYSQTKTHCTWPPQYLQDLHPYI